MKKLALLLVLLPLAGCDVLQQAAEDQVRNEISERADAAANEFRSVADEHLNAVAPELSNRIDDVQNHVADAQQMHREIQNQAGQLE